MKITVNPKVVANNLLIVEQATTKSLKKMIFNLYKLYLFWKKNGGNNTASQIIQTLIYNLFVSFFLFI